jgi:hypothetical protein
VYKDHYALDKEDFDKKLVERENKSQLDNILSKTLMHYFKEYRNDDSFFIEALKSSKRDLKKLEKYFQLTRCYITYLNSNKHTNISNTLKDEAINDSFDKKVNDCLGGRFKIEVVSQNSGKSTPKSKNGRTKVRSKASKEDSIQKNKSIANEPVMTIMEIQNEDFEQNLQDLLEKMKEKLPQERFVEILNKQMTNYLPPKQETLPANSWSKNTFFGYCPNSPLQSFNRETTGAAITITRYPDI